MVSISALSGIIFTLLVCFVLPIVLAVLVCRKKPRRLLVFLAGTLSFLVPQLMIRVPLLGTDFVQSFLLGWGPWSLSVFYAFTAALFETTGRFLLFWLVLRHSRSFEDGIAAGIGHGGIEAITIVGFSYVNNLIFAIALNQGNAAALLQSAGQTQNAANTMIATITSVPAQSFYFAGIERLFTIGVQIFFSTLLLSFMVRKKTLVGFLFVLALHTAMDFALPVIGNLFGQLWLSELLLAIFSIAAMVFLVRRRKTLFPAQTEAS
ncbi:MAG: hypothetical protein PWQ08_751 [Clostridiales bacterium]|jgi:uncharacterized membrane protein YhfC|nr:hypothetical protein [Clostridiales bacterium]